MTMINMRKVGSSLLGAATVMASVALAGTAHSNVKPYQGIPADQAEFISTPDHIISMVSSGAPTAIWQTLEHGESVECLACIPYVSPLLYNANAKNREIAAWWLRRRTYGVFGPGEVYSQTIQNLASNSDPTTRSYAASALGEFLITSGIGPVATALEHDSSALVRAAAASALGRLNDDGSGGNVPGALAVAFSDSDPGVRTAAYVAAGRINSFVDVSSAVKVTGDSDALVRRAGVQLLDEMDAADAVAAVMSLAQNDPDSEVRLVSCHALGTFGDTSAVSALTSIMANDTNMQVQDQARIALQRIQQ
jgi:HEAT repeat protein